MFLVLAINNSHYDFIHIAMGFVEEVFCALKDILHVFFGIVTVNGLAFGINTGGARNVDFITLFI